MEQHIEKMSFYQKLAHGDDVNLLIVGDSIGAGYGATDIDHSWVSLLSSTIRSEYSVNVKLTNVSMGSNSSYAGYVRTMVLDDGFDYDLVIICYGQNDNNYRFSLYYEAIICAVKQRYSQASIILILESSQRVFTEKIQAIQSLGQHYGLSVVDTITPFQCGYDSYVKDGLHPNDLGYQIYYEQVMGTIRSNVSACSGFAPRQSTSINAEVGAFFPFCWYDVDRCYRQGNTYTYAMSLKGTILGIDCIFVSGEKCCDIFIDEVKQYSPTIRFDYGYSERRIRFVNNWLEGDYINAHYEIKIVFSEDETGSLQAEGFKGIAISG